MKIWLLQERNELIQKRLAMSVQTVNTLAHPMVLIGANPFLDLSWDCLKTFHEGVRNEGFLVFLDTVDAIAAFKQKGYAIVFFSYQWLSAVSPGPNDVQLACMEGCLEKLQATAGISLDRMVIWLDILSIPQRCFNVKSLAVYSLYAYARYSDYLIITAPSSSNSESGVPADIETYKKRVWCRTELMAFICNCGMNGLYMTVGVDRLEKASKAWMEDVALIFDGDMTCCTHKHPGGKPCDRLSIVPPLIGMYFDLYVKKHSGSQNDVDKDTWEFIESRKDDMFPRTFICSTIKNGKEVSEELELFGDMIERVADFVEQDVDRAIALSTAKVVDDSETLAAHGTYTIVLPLESHVTGERIGMVLEF